VVFANILLLICVINQLFLYNFLRFIFYKMHNLIVFISDIHLSPKYPQKNILFREKLLEWRGKIDALYMLGDIFDYWLTDDDPDFADNMDALSEFTKFTPVYMILGNHDFLISNKFVEKTKVKIIEDLSVLELKGNRIMLSHGDIFCTKDIGYQLLKLFLQNRVIIKMAQTVTLKTKLKVKSMIEFVVDKGRKNPPNYYSHRYSVVNKSMAKHLTKKQAKILIHGHTHRPNKYSIDEDTIRYELPDWHGRFQGGYLLYDNGVFQLHKGLEIDKHGKNSK
jgi:UDP-2,3-diacylglucosamine hydrolase